MRDHKLVTRLEGRGKLCMELTTLHCETKARDLTSRETKNEKQLAKKEKKEIGKGSKVKESTRNAQKPFDNFLTKTLQLSLSYFPLQSSSSTPSIPPCPPSSVSFQPTNHPTSLLNLPCTPSKAFLSCPNASLPLVP